LIQKYLQRNAFLEPQLFHPIADDLAFIIVIPARNEPQLIATLRSIMEAQQPNSSYEVLIVFNHSEADTKEIKADNLASYTTCVNWLKEQNHAHIHPIEAFDLPSKHAGVGLARKIGMDEALRRLEGIPGGFILCLDADCLVASNYLLSIESYFKEHPEIDGASIYFEHPLHELSNDQKEGIIQYELHLRYYNQILRFAGHPFAYHTVGSSMAVRTAAYVKQGGMNKRKAGEDFYFLQKIIQLGSFGEIKNTVVYPSARLSDRVPFGTGRAMKEWLNENKSDLLSYHPEVALHLKKLVDNIRLKGKDIQLQELPSSIIQFISKEEWESKLDELRSNTKSKAAFIDRFFAWFNLFICFKYVHYFRDNIQANIPVREAAAQFLLMENSEIEKGSSTAALLAEFRKRER
jgi:glycosyltransferase involved in cell wall biosynthesis